MFTQIKVPLLPMETGVDDKAIQAQAGFLEEAPPAYPLAAEDRVQKQFIKGTMLVTCLRLLRTLY